MSIRFNQILIVTMAIFTAVPACLTGCASGSKADTTTESMAAATSRMEKANAQIDAVIVALDGLVAAKGGDLKPANKKFNEAVANVESSASSTKNATAKMKERAKEQFDAWAAESQKINDPNLKQANAERREHARAAFAKVQDASQKAREAYDPFIADLHDVQTYLKTDLTAGGIDAIAPTVAKVKTDSQTLKDAIAAVQHSIDDVKAQLVASTAPATK